MFKTIGIAGDDQYQNKNSKQKYCMNCIHFKSSGKNQNWSLSAITTS